MTKGAVPRPPSPTAAEGSGGIAEGKGEGIASAPGISRMLALEVELVKALLSGSCLYTTTTTTTTTNNNTTTAATTEQSLVISPTTLLALQPPAAEGLYEVGHHKSPQ